MRRYNQQIEDAYSGSQRQGDLMRNRNIEQSSGQDRRNRYRDDRHQLEMEHNSFQNSGKQDNREGRQDDDQRFGTRGGEYSDDVPPLQAATSENSRSYRGYSEEDYPYYKARMKRTDYPDTYRSAMGGYIHQYVADDMGRKDPNYGAQNVNGSPGLHKGKGPKNYKRSDQRLTEEINDRLTEDDAVDATHIDIQVQNGEVTVTGTVRDRAEKRRVEDIIESVSGVTHVEIRLRTAASINA
jgi:osmotically-inducible protein OsmY